MNIRKNVGCICQKNRMFNENSRLCYIMILINHILEITPDYVESIFCFDKLKELVVGLVTSSFICKIFID